MHQNEYLWNKGLNYLLVTEYYPVNDDIPHQLSSPGPTWLSCIRVVDPKIYFQNAKNQEADLFYTSLVLICRKEIVVEIKLSSGHSLFEILNQIIS